MYSLQSISSAKNSIETITLNSSDSLKDSENISRCLPPFTLEEILSFTRAFEDSLPIEQLYALSNMYTLLENSKKPSEQEILIIQKILQAVPIPDLMSRIDAQEIFIVHNKKSQECWDIYQEFRQSVAKECFDDSDRDTTSDPTIDDGDSKGAVPDLKITLPPRFNPFWYYDNRQPKYLADNELTYYSLF